MTPPESPSPTAPQSGQRRYPGVRSFEEQDQTRFRGRSAATEELLLRVLSVRLLLQFAPSGVGKTSLLNAGLFPRLRPHDYFPFIVRLNLAGESLTEAVRRAMQDAAKRCGLSEPLIPEQAPDLWQLLAGAQLWSDDLRLLTPVLVFDQFEEVFTLRDEAFRKAFAAEIGDLAAGQRRQAAAEPGESGVPPLKIIISLREEYLGKLEEFSASIPSLFQERLRLPPLSATEAREAIVEPARLPGTHWATPPFGFKPECLDFLIDFIDGLSASVRIIEPLTLQLVCQQAETLVLQRPAADGAARQLAEADFEGQAGLERLVRNYYLQELGKLADATTRRRAREMFEEGLLDPAGKRLMLEQGEIERKYRLDETALNALVASSLLRREPRNESIFYEISHDRLTDTIAKNRGVRVPRWVKGTIAASVIVIVVLGVFLRQAYQAKQAALESRQQAEDALKLLLSENLVSRLREAGLTDALNDVLTKVNITSFGPAYALTLRHEGDILRERGTLNEARDKYTQALDAIELLLAGPDVDGADLRAEQARTQRRLGALEADAGDVTAAEVRYAAAVATWKQVLGGPPEARNTLDAAETRVELGSLRLRMGELERAEVEYAEALRLAFKVWNAAYDRVQSGSADIRFEFGRAIQIYADAALGMARLWSDDSHARSAVALAQESLRLRPLSAPARGMYAAATATFVQLSGSQGLDAAKSFAEARRQFEDMAEIDPQNRPMREARASLALVSAAGLVACAESDRCKKKPTLSELQEANVATVAAIGQLRWLAGLDKDNHSLQSDVIWGLSTRAELLRASGSPALGQPVIDEALTLARKNLTDAKDIDGALRVVGLLRTKAALFAREGDPTAALSTLEAAHEAMGGLPESLLQVKFALAENLALKSTQLKKLRRTAEAQQVDASYKDLLDKLGTPWEAKSKRARALNDEGIALYKQALLLKERPQADKSREAQAKFEQAVLENPFEATYWKWLRTAQMQIALATRDIVASLPAAATAASGVAAPHDPAATALEDSWQAALGAAVASAWMARVLSPDELLAGSWRELYETRRSLMMFLQDRQRPLEVLPLLEQGASDVKEYARQNPGAADALFLQADVNAGLGMLRWESGSDGWEEALRTALSFGELLAAKEPGNGERRVWLGNWRLYLAERMKESNREAESVASYRQSLIDCRAGLQLLKNHEASAGARNCLDDLEKAGYR